MIIEKYKVERPALAIHGGAGRWERAKAEEEKYLGVLEKSLLRGYEHLRSRNNRIESVIEAVKVLEDSMIYNAGSGSSLNIAGEREMDAGLMDGETLKAGAVTLVKNTKNPIELAYLIYRDTDHMIIGCHGAEKIAEYYKLEKPPAIPKHVFNRYKEALKNIDKVEYIRRNKDLIDIYKEEIYGTVGAVAIDVDGKLAAATSTGGIMLKLPGRIGDTPIPGSGFYSDSYVACSATGIGESILSISLCRSIALHYRYTKDLEKSVTEAFRELESIWGKNTAGVIAISNNNTLIFAYNTTTMARGYKDPNNIYFRVF